MFYFFSYLCKKNKIMVVSTNLKVALDNYKWVVRVLESSQTREHLDCTEKCFNLWIERHLDTGSNRVENKFLIRLRNNFWSCFHQKRISLTFKKKSFYNTTT
jgi:hypothetical protein